MLLQDPCDSDNKWSLNDTILKHFGAADLIKKIIFNQMNLFEMLLWLLTSLKKKIAVFMSSLWLVKHFLVSKFTLLLDQQWFLVWSLVLAYIHGYIFTLQKSTVFN